MTLSAVVDTALPTALVNVRSGLVSKTNVAQALSGVAMVLTLITGGAFNLSGEEQAAIVTVIGVLNNVVTFVLKKWFTPTVNASSLVTPTVTVAR